MRSPRPRARYWIAALNVLILLLTMSLPAFADTPPVAPTATQLDLLTAYRIVRGDDTGNYNLDKPITRAEMFTIMVRALGKDEMATGYQGLGLFDDSKGHWADGYLSYAKTQGLAKGDGSNKVEPNRPVTNGEALTMILRVIGQEPTTGTWPMNVMLEAIDLKIVPEGITAGNLSEPAVRGIAFTALARALSLPANNTGITHFQRNLDTTPPTLTVNQLDASTTAQKVTIAGTASGATSVLVNDTSIALQGNTFSTQVDLKFGANEITVEALDLLGNKATSEVKISRIQPIARLEVAGPAKVPVNGTATFTITAFNAANQAVSLDGVTATVTNGLGIFDVTTGQFKAANKAGLGQIVLTSGSVVKNVDIQVLGPSASAASLVVTPGAVVSPNRDMTVEVRVVDSAANLVSDDFGREVRLSATGLSGLVVSPASTLTVGGVAEFKVRGAATGLFTLTATSGSLTAGSAVGEIGTPIRVVLTADPGNITLGGAVSLARIKAQLVDESGNAVRNTSGTDIVVDLSTANTDGSLIDNLIVINRGESTSTLSGNDGMFTVGFNPGTVTIGGRISTGHNYTVVPATLTTTRPSLGNASRLRAIGLTPQGNTAEFLIMVTDHNDNQITAGNVAFQVKVATSNNDPENVSVTIADTYNPVTDNIAEGNAQDTGDVIARTVAGAAVLRVTYNKPGVVTITPVGAPSTNDGVSRDGIIGSASSSSGMNMAAGTVVFSSTIGGVSLAVDSDLGADQIAGGARTTASKTMVLRARVTDSQGNWIPGTSGRVTLVREDAGPTYSTTLPVDMTLNATDGEAEYRLTTTSREGTSKFHVTLTINPGTADEQTFTSNTVDIQVQSAAPEAPVIAAVRGVRDGMPGSLNMVATDDTDLEIDLMPISGEKYGVIKVYSGSNLLWTTNVFDLSGTVPRVTIPKAKLPNGIFTIQVTARNGYGESARSTPSPDITKAIEVTNVYVSSARYDATTNQMIVYGSGFNANDTLITGLLEIRDGGTIRSLGGAAITSMSGGQMTLNLSGLGIADDLEDPAVFAGKDVRIDALAGWYTRRDGQTAKEDLDNAVTPMGTINYVVYDRSNRRLTLKGSGFDTGTIDFTKLKLHIPGMDDPTTPGYIADYALSGMSQSKRNDSEWVITLSTTVADSLNAHGDYVLNADAAWQVDGGSKRAAISNIPIQAAATVREATYDADTDTLTLTGVGFLNGNVNVGALRLKDTDKSKTVTLDGGTVTNPVASDTTITIKLHTDDVTMFENTANFAVNIYLEADAGWFVNQYGMDSAAIPVPSIRLPSRVTP